MEKDLQDLDGKERDAYKAEVLRLEGENQTNAWR